MRRRTMLALLAGGTAAVTAGILARRWILYGAETAAPDEDAIFTAFAPGGRAAFFCNGPVGRVMSKVMPVAEAGLYEAVAEMLGLQPDDELLDIGCGPGAFLATQAREVRRVVGLDPSPIMVHEAERRLADRLAAGTARIVSGNAAALPFDDGEFSAATAIAAPAKLPEVFRVLRPGGRFVIVDPDPKMSVDEPSTTWGLPRWGEADYRRRLEDAGFGDLAVRFVTGGVSARFLGYTSALLVSGRKPPASISDDAAQVGDRRELVGSMASA